MNGLFEWFVKFMLILIFAPLLVCLLLQATIGVLAAADGRVLVTTNRPGGCGHSVFISHDQFACYTVYCHLKEVLVKPGDAVKRGETIGLVGTTGNAVGVPHVHLELCTATCYRGHADGDLRDTEDPLTRADGCFDPKKQYPADRLVLTYPVKC